MDADAMQWKERSSLGEDLHPNPCDAGIEHFPEDPRADHAPAVREGDKLV